jgi:putative membrane protein
VGGPWAAGFGWLFFLVPLFWIAVIVLFVALLRRRGGRGGWGPGYYGPHGYWGGASRSAESTLAERFAQGDIDEKEYRARLEVLRANNPVPPAK